MDKRIKEYHKKYKNIENEIITLEDKIAEGIATTEDKKNLRKLQDQLDDFVWNDYSKVIFDVFNEKQPKVKDRFSNEVKTFKEAFGSNYSKISKSLRESLVGLIIDDGRYKLK